MATVRNLKIKSSTCKRIIKELHAYEKEVEREAAKTAEMKDNGADPYDLKQQENVLAESRMMIPDSHKRLEASLADLKQTPSWRSQIRKKALKLRMLEALSPKLSSSSGPQRLSLSMPHLW